VSQLGTFKERPSMIAATTNTIATSQKTPWDCERDIKSLLDRLGLINWP
jgi:hypothetical protein